MHTFISYLKEMADMPVPGKRAAEKEEVPIDSVDDLGEDEIEVTPAMDKFLDEVGEIYPEATVVPGYSPSELRIHIAEEQRPESIKALFAGLGFEEVGQGNYHRGTINVYTSSTRDVKWTLNVQDLEQ